MLPATCGFKLVHRTIAERYHKKRTLVPCQARSLPAAGGYGKADLKLVASDCDLSSSVSSLASTSAFRQTIRRITCTQEADSQLTEKYPCLCVLLLHCEQWPAIAFFAMVRSSFHRDRLQGWSSHNGATLTMNVIPQDRKCKQKLYVARVRGWLRSDVSKSHNLKFKGPLPSNQFKLLNRFARRHARVNFCP